MTQKTTHPTNSTFQAFQVSRLLHHLTNIVTANTKKYSTEIYYDIDKTVSRYIVTDYIALKKTLEELMLFFTRYTSFAEVVLTLCKEKDNTLSFKISSTSALIQSSRDINFPVLTYKDKYLDLNFSASNTGDIFCTFSVPFIEDKYQQSYREELNQLLYGKRALIVVKNKDELIITQNIFESYGIEVEHINPDIFKSSKVDFSNYDILILRSSDLTPQQLNFFKNISQEKKDLKIIAMHEIFVTQIERERTLSISHAEIFRPTIIGDVEEVFRQLYIENAVKNEDCCTENIQRLQLFKITEDNNIKKKDLTKYAGRNILILNNHELSLKLIKSILTIDGINVYTAKNLLEAEDLLRRRKIDIIFAEVNLSLKQCKSFIEQLKNNINCKYIPIISISSFSFDHDLIEMMEHGINGHIPVPYTAVHLYSAVNQYMQPKYDSLAST